MTSAIAFAAGASGCLQMDWIAQGGLENSLCAEEYRISSLIYECVTSSGPQQILTPLHIQFTEYSA